MKILILLQKGQNCKTDIFSLDSEELPIQTGFESIVKQRCKAKNLNSQLVCNISLQKTQLSIQQSVYINKKFCKHFLLVISQRTKLKIDTYVKSKFSIQFSSFDCKSFVLVLHIKKRAYKNTLISQNVFRQNKCQCSLSYVKILYSSNKIRKTKNEHLIIIC